MSAPFALNWTRHFDGRAREGSAAPSEGREGHAMWEYGGKIYVFGGDTQQGAQQSNELFAYEISTGTWSRPVTTGPTPSPRTGACASLINGGKVIVFGGADASSETIWQNDIHILDLATLTWTSPAITSGQPPTIRDKAACCSFGSRFVVYGGFGPAPTADVEREDEGDEDEDEDEEALAAIEGPRMSFKWFGDVHVFDATAMTWRECTPMPGSTDVPTARCATTLCCTAGDNTAMMFGGRAATGERVNDLWSLRVDAAAGIAEWHRMRPAGTLPQPRSFHTLVAATHQRLVLFGGLSNLASHYSDVQVLDTGGECTWQEVPPSLGMSPRGFHSAVVAAGRMFVYGGGSSYDPAINACTVLHNDLYSLDLAPLL